MYIFVLYVYNFMSFVYSSTIYLLSNCCGSDPALVAVGIIKIKIYDYFPWEM